MAVTRTYSVALVRSLDPFFLSTDIDLTSLASGGVYASSTRAGETFTNTFNANGDRVADTGGHLGVASSVAQLADGRTVLATSTGSEIHFKLGATTTGVGEIGVGVGAPDVAALKNGGFVIAYQDKFEGGDLDVNVRIFSAGGTLVREVAPDFSAAKDYDPRVTSLSDGGFVVAWHREFGGAQPMQLWYAVYEADGTIRKAATILDQSGTYNRGAHVVSLDGGGFAIAYEHGTSTPDGTNVDIRLARIDASGDNAVITGVAATANYELGSVLTKLSNGMLLIGGSIAAPGSSNASPLWIVVDPATGLALAKSTLGATADRDYASAAAGMTDGRFAAFFESSDQNGGQTLTGQVLEARRTTTGDAAANVITGDSLRDIVLAGAGNDSITGKGGADRLYGQDGNDTFFVVKGEGVGDLIDGGVGVDRVMTYGLSVDLTRTTFAGVEELWFQDALQSCTTLLRSDQIGGGLASNLVIQGVAGQTDTVRITMGTDRNLDLSAVRFRAFDSDGMDRDRIMVVGDNDAEAIVGSSRADDIFGFGGADTISGGGGADVMRGGLGDDLYIVDRFNDQVLEALNQGYDTVRCTGGGGYRLGANIERLELTGNGDDLAAGNNLNNVIIANAGANRIIGGAGNDTLKGGAGADQFFFEVALNATTNVDTITDFQINVDVMMLNTAVFKGPPIGSLDADAFFIGAKAADAEDRIIYNKTTGDLFYDRDGTGAAAQIRFAHLTANLALDAADFQVFQYL